MTSEWQEFPWNSNVGWFRQHRTKKKFIQKKINEDIRDFNGVVSIKLALAKAEELIDGDVILKSADHTWYSDGCEFTDASLTLTGWQTVNEDELAPYLEAVVKQKEKNAKQREYRKKQVEKRKAEDEKYRQKALVRARKLLAEAGEL